MEAEEAMDGETLTELVKSLILAKDFPTASQIVLESNKGEEVLLKVLEETEGHFGENILMFRAVASGGSEDPDAKFKEIQELYPSTQKCEVSWSGNHVAYRCFTCGIHETSCMCSDCFVLSQHEGHDYRIYRSGVGGCCDCGDGLAWKPEGFCPKHKGLNRKEDPALDLPEDVSAPCQLAVAVLMKSTTAALQRLSEAESEVGRNSRILLHLTLGCLDTFATVCAGFRSIVCRALELPFGEDSTALEIWLNSALTVPEDLVDQCSMVYLHLLFDAAHKHIFTEAFLKCYPRYLSSILNPDTPNKRVEMMGTYLDRIYCQLFHHESLCIGFVNSDTYDVFADNLLTLFGTCASGLGMEQGMEVTTAEGSETLSPLFPHFFNVLAPEDRAYSAGFERGLAGRVVVPKGKVFEENGYSRVFNDIRSLVTHGALSRWIIWGINPGLRTVNGVSEDATCAESSRVSAPHPIFCTLLRMVCSLQFANPQIRQFGQHVHWMNHSYQATFLLEHEVLSVLRTMLYALNDYRVSGPPADWDREAVLGGMLADPAAVAAAERNWGIAATVPPDSGLGLRGTAEANLLHTGTVLRSILEVICDWEATHHVEAVPMELLTLPKENAKFWSDHERILRECSLHPVSSLPQSFHIPLHRLFGILLHMALSNPEGSTSVCFPAEEDPGRGARTVLSQCLDLFGGDSLALGELLMERPLQILTWVKHCICQKWVRNGDVMYRQLSFYLGRFWHDIGHDIDFLLVQIGAILVGGDRTVQRVLEYSEVERVFELGSSSDDDEDVVESSDVDCAIEALRLLIAIAIEPTMSGCTTRERIKRTVIHWLSCEDLTFKALSDRIPPLLLDGKDFEEVLHQVADYNEPQIPLSKGKFRLKDEYIREASPLFAVFTRLSVERQSRYVQRRTEEASAAPGETPKGTLPHAPALPNLFPALLSLPKTILFSHKFLSTLGIVLTNAFRSIEQRKIHHEDSDAPSASIRGDERLLLLAIYGLTLAAQLCPDAQDSSRESLPVPLKFLLLESGSVGTFPLMNESEWGEAGLPTMGDLPLRMKPLLLLLLQLQHEETVETFHPHLARLVALLREKSPFMAEAIDLLRATYCTVAVVDETAEHTAEVGPPEVGDLQQDALAEMRSRAASQISEWAAMLSSSDEEEEEEEEDAMSVDGVAKTGSEESLWREPQCVANETTCVVCREEGCPKNPLGLIRMTYHPSFGQTHLRSLWGSKRWFWQKEGAEREEEGFPWRATTTLSEEQYANEHFQAVLHARAGATVVDDSTLAEFCGLCQDGLCDGVAPNGLCGTTSGTAKTGLGLLTCGHCIHLSCLDSLIKSSASMSLQEGMQLLDKSLGEFLCPICRRLANGVLPILPCRSDTLLPPTVSVPQQLMVHPVVPVDDEDEVAATSKKLQEDERLKTLRQRLFSSVSDYSRVKRLFSIERRGALPEGASLGLWIAKVAETMAPTIRADARNVESTPRTSEEGSPPGGVAEKRGWLSGMVKGVKSLFKKKGTAEDEPVPAMRWSFEETDDAAVSPLRAKGKNFAETVSHLHKLTKQLYQDESGNGRMSGAVNTLVSVLANMELVSRPESILSPPPEEEEEATMDCLGAAFPGVTALQLDTILLMFRSLLLYAHNPIDPEEKDASGNVFDEALAADVLRWRIFGPLATVGVDRAGNLSCMKFSDWLRTSASRLAEKEESSSVAPIKRLFSSSASLIELQERFPGSAENDSLLLNMIEIGLKQRLDCGPSAVGARLIVERDAIQTRACFVTDSPFAAQIRPSLLSLDLPALLVRWMLVCRPESGTSLDHLPAEFLHIFSVLYSASVVQALVLMSFHLAKKEILEKLPSEPTKKRNRLSERQSVDALLLEVLQATDAATEGLSGILTALTNAWTGVLEELVEETRRVDTKSDSVWADRLGKGSAAASDVLELLKLGCFGDFPENTVDTAVRLLVEPFVRTAALFYCGAVAVNTSTVDGSPPRSAVSCLPPPLAGITPLQAVSGAGPGQSEGWSSLLIDGWLKHFFACVVDAASCASVNPLPLASCSPVAPVLPPMLPCIPYSFGPFPETLEELLIPSAHTEKCADCGNVPKSPAVCLACGTLVCCRSECCMTGEGIGEVTRHAHACTGELGAFQYVHGGRVILVLGYDRRVVWGSLYLDEHGEQEHWLVVSSVDRCELTRCP